MSDLINILSIIDDKSQLINFPKLDPNSFKPAVLTLIQRLKDTVKAEPFLCLVGCRAFKQCCRHA